MGVPIATRITTWLHGRYVGKDVFGNRYYEARRQHKSEFRRRRWVMYNGIPEASKIPPQWHGWMHYTFAAPLPETKKHGWQKEHQPNLTGTVGRYLPSGHISKPTPRAKAEADYTPWSPQ